MELEEFVSNVDDMTEPSCMETLFMHLDQLKAEDDDFIQLLVDRVRHETITWKQPWYQLSKCLTRPMDNTDGNETETFRTDSFSKAESDHIAKNWKRFRKRFNVPDTPACLARWRNRNTSRNPSRSLEEQARHFVIAFLAKGLERNLYQVYTFFVAQYGAQRKGAYSKTEEKVMQICFHHKPTNAVPYLAAILGREPRGISKRLQMMYQGKPEKKRVKWTLPLATKFLKSLIQHSGMSLDDLKYRRFDKSVWLKVQEDMDHHYIYLQYFWYTFLHVQLFVKYIVKIKQLRRKILKKLKLSSYEVWTDIQWKELQREFPDGFTHKFLYNAVVKLVQKYPEPYRKAPLKDVVEFGLDKLETIKINKKKRLKTLILNEDGDLISISYSIKMP